MEAIWVQMVLMAVVAVGEEVAPRGVVDEQAEEVGLEEKAK